jgi:hypothetical protein
MSANWFGNPAPDYLGSMFGPTGDNGNDVVSEILSIGDTVAVTVSFGVQTSETLSLAAEQGCQLDFFALLEETGLSLGDSVDATIAGTAVSDILGIQDAVDATVTSNVQTAPSAGGSGGGRSIFIESYRLKNGKVIPVKEEPLTIKLPSIVFGKANGRISFAATASGSRAARDFGAKITPVRFGIKNTSVSAVVVSFSGPCHTRNVLRSKAHSRTVCFAKGKVSSKLRFNCRKTYKTTSSFGRAKFTVKPSNPPVEIGTFGAGRISACISISKPDAIHSVEFSDEQMALIAAMTEEMMSG